MRTMGTAAVAVMAAVLSLGLLACQTGTSPSTDSAEDPVYADNVVVVSGNIVSATTWLAGKVYYLGDAVYVESGATLTIQPGAIVKFGTEGLIDIAQGTMIADGTAGSPIIFTSIRDAAIGGDSILNDGTTGPAKGDWNYVWADVSSSGNVFRHCEFRYAGRDAKAALYVDGSTTVDNCVFHDNLCGLPQAATQEATLDARNTVSATVITNNLFYNNTWPLAVPANYSLGASNSFSFDHDSDAATPALANTHQAIFLGNSGGEITGNVAWSETEVPLCFFDNSWLYVDAAGTLSIASGAAVKFSGTASGIYIADGGSFSYDTAASRTFTSYRDDSVMGDTNADGSASAAEAGDWAGIWEDAGSSYLAAGVAFAANAP